MRLGPGRVNLAFSGENSVCLLLLPMFGSVFKTAQPPLNLVATLQWNVTPRIWHFLILPTTVFSFVALKIWITDESDHTGEGGLYEAEPSAWRPLPWDTLFLLLAGTVLSRLQSRDISPADPSQWRGAPQTGLPNYSGFCLFSGYKVLGSTERWVHSTGYQF